MKFRLIETIITEGKNIDRTWDQYKNKIINKMTKENPNLFKDISDMPFVGDGYDEITDQNEIERRAKDAWISLLAYDPTMNKNPNNTTTGDFGIWLTNRYLDGQIDWYNSDNLSKTLSDFIKKKVSLDKKDINQYKTVDELEKAIKNTSLTPRQKERQLRTAYKDSNVIYADEDWVVYQVTSYASACTLGKGTRWCTAYSDNDEYYQSYAKDGKLYVIVNINDQSEKYQLFIPNDNAVTNFQVEMHDKYDADMHGNTNHFIDVNEFLSTKATEGLKEILEKLGIHKKLTNPENADVLAVMEATGQTEEEAKESLENENFIFIPDVHNDEEFGREEFNSYSFDESLESYVNWELIGCDTIIDEYNGDVDKAMEEFGVSMEQYEDSDFRWKEGMSKSAPSEFLQEVGRDYWYRTDDTVLEPYFDFEQFGYDQRSYKDGEYTRYGLVILGY